MARKWGKSLTLAVGAREATGTDVDVDTLAMGLKTTNIESALHLARKLVVETKEDKNGVWIQEIENSAPTPPRKKNELANEIEVVGVVLLSVSGFFTGFSVKFLIDSGASEWFRGYCIH